MTEEEAKTKWCPSARDGDGLVVGTGGTNRRGHMCIASACMAWRMPPTWPDQDGYFHDNTEGHGFCGLAGGSR